MEPSQHEHPSQKDTSPQQISNNVRKDELKHPAGGIVALWGTSLAYVLIGAVVLILAGLSLIYAASGSLPGERLYPLKIGFVEKLNILGMFNARAHTSYNIERLEERLLELKTLSRDTSTSSPETLSAVALSIDSNVRDAVATIEGASALSDEERLNSLLLLTSIVSAEDEIVDETQEFESMKDSIQVSRRVALESLESTIQHFASTSPSLNVSEYIGTHVEAVGVDIEKLARGSNAERLAVARINDMSEALQDGNIVGALAYILRARQAIAVDRYLFDAERGPTENTPQTPTEIPEGN